MSGPGWDTRNPGGSRAGGRSHLALIVGAALLTIAILAAVTGKVLASNPPTLMDSSPAADHTKTPAPDRSPGPPDPRSLFLDLPDPPKPQAPEAQDQDFVTSQVAASSARLEKTANVDDRGGDAADVRSVGRSAGVRPAGRAPDIPMGASEAGRAPKTRSVEPGSGNVEDLLDDPDCRFSAFALMDLRAGVVDEYLVSALQAVCREHSIYVNVFKTGHTFGAGLAEGPTIPVGYGNAGGYPNTHYFGRGADIWEVDGKPVEGNGADPDVISVGRILAGLPSKNKPDVVIGPAAWNQALGYGPDQGWVLDEDQVFLHDDHLHIGYWHGDGTPPPQLFLSTNDRYEVPAPANGGVRAPAVRSFDSDSDRTNRRTPKLKETIEPAKSPTSNPRFAGDAGVKKDREKPAPRKVVERRIQRPGAQGINLRKLIREKAERKTSQGQRLAPDVKQPELGKTTRDEEQTTDTENTSVQYETQVEEVPFAEGAGVDDAAAAD